MYAIHQSGRSLGPLSNTPNTACVHCATTQTQLVSAVKSERDNLWLLCEKAGTTCVCCGGQQTQRVSAV